MLVVPVSMTSVLTAAQLSELLCVAGERALFLAVLGADGAAVYLRVRPGIDEQPLEELLAQKVSAHKRRHKRASQQQH